MTIAIDSSDLLEKPSDHWDGDLRDALQSLLRQAARAGIVDPTLTASQTCPVQGPLTRLLDGAPRHDDQRQCGVTVAEARVWWIEVGDADRAALRRVLDQECIRYVERGDHVEALVRPVLRSECDEGRGAIRRLARRVSGTGASIVIGVSAPAHEVGDLPLLREHARDAAQAHIDRVVFAEEHWADLTLRRVSRSLAGTLGGADPLAALRRRDPKSAEHLTATLAVWLRHNRDTTAAAAELFVHPNTLRYRLRRVCELTGVDLDDPRQRLVLELLLVS